MAKVLLVEDDNNLREIYEARLQAEGYEIVSARDGEEALVVAKAEQPDLVISDVMMPKISGFEMLDILRNTEGLKDVKVIMLTALGQAEDQTRADSLGADRYLVKSQVTLEDIVNAAKQLLTGETAEPATAAPAEAPTTEATPAPASQAPADEPAAPETTPPVIPLAPPPADDTADPAEPVAPPPADTTVPTPPADTPADTPVADTSTDDNQQTNAQEQATVDQQITDFVQSQPGTPPAAAEPTATAVPAEEPTTTPEQDQALNEAVTTLSGGEAPAAPAADAPPAETTAPEAEEAGTTTHKKVIVPISDEETPKKSLDELLAEENAKEAAVTAAPATEAPDAPTDAPAPDQAAAPAPAADQAEEAPKPPASTPAPGNKSDFDPNSIAL